MKNRIFTIATLLLLSATLQAQTAPITRSAPPSASSAPATPVTVADAIALTQAKVSDDIILVKIAQANQPLNLSTEDILQLKQAGVSDSVVRALIAPVATTHVVVTNQSFEQYHSMNPTGATPPYSAPATATDDPMAPHDSGIYLNEQGASGTQLQYLDRAAITGTEENAGSVFSFFAVPLTVRYVVQPPKATVRVNSAMPVFYFYFENKSAGLGKASHEASDATNPNQFQLLQLAASKKERTLPAMKFGIFVGVSNGEKPLPFTTDRLSDGVYRVTVTKPLKPGEYAFVLTPPQTASTAGSPMDPNAPKPDIYDFAIDPA